MELKELKEFKAFKEFIESQKFEEFVAIRLAPGRARVTHTFAMPVLCCLRYVQFRHKALAQRHC